MITDKHMHTTAIVAATAGVASIAFIFSVYRSKKLKSFGKTCLYDAVQIVDNKDQCDIVIQQLMSGCSTYRVLGFDCEWLTVSGSRQPVALLQLASNDGFCALFRLCKLKCIPHSLKEILENPTILKVGVAPIDDARYLMSDYAVQVKSTLDLRYLALLAKHKPEGLAALSKSLLNVELNKNWQLSCSDWEIADLMETQINYAANDAYVAVKIFEKLEQRLQPQSLFRWIGLIKANEDWNTIYNRFNQYYDVKFKMKSGFKNDSSSSSSSSHSLRSRDQQNSLDATSNRNGSRNVGTRKKPLYHSCFLEAPDGELLCTCDTDKAKWYIEKGIGELVREEPFTVRLRFEPAGRSTGFVSRYYQAVRENICVVCGKRESHTKKNVVPREYRKLFPGILKDHSSHDVLLLCINCHRLSNLKDQNLRLELAVLCDAPINDRADPKFVENADLKKVRSAAKVLLNMKAGRYRLPEERVQELQNIVLSHFVNQVEVTEDMLKEASAITFVFENGSHGQKVVEYFVKSSSGLLDLELMWRDHFVSSMEPKFLPTLWSIDHSKNRLAINVEEGIDPNDAILAGDGDHLEVL